MCQSCPKGLKALISTKLGRCSTCMRLLLTGALSAWLIYILVNIVWPMPLVVKGSVLLWAMSFTLLWLLHIGAFIRRTVSVQRILSQAKQEVVIKGLRPSRRSFLNLCLKGAAGAVLLSLPLGKAAFAAPCPECDCYFSEDCGFFSYCNYVKCIGDPKGTGNCPNNKRHPLGTCDGVCTFFLFSANEIGSRRPEIITALEHYFNAYKVPVAAGGGRPDEKLLSQARNVDLPEGVHKELHGAVISTLRVVLARDFIVEEFDENDPECPAIIGVVITVPNIEAGVAIVEAAGMGWVSAILMNDSKAAIPPLVDFWNQFPDYMPANPYRCYPHEHVPHGWASPLECQTAEFMGMLEALLLAPPPTSANAKGKLATSWGKIKSRY